MDDVTLVPYEGPTDAFRGRPAPEEMTCRDRRPLGGDAVPETTGPFHTDGDAMADFIERITPGVAPRG